MGTKTKKTGKKGGGAGKAPGKDRPSRTEEAAAVWVEPSELKPWAKNPRKNDGKPVDQVVESIRRFGFASPIIARAETKEVIAGHTRLKAAETLGLKLVPVRYVDLNEREAHLLALADNRLAETADWDVPKLQEVMGSFDLPALEVAGWNADDLDKMAADLAGGEPPEVEEDESPEAPADPVTKLGDVWAMGDHRLVCGDATDPSSVRLLMGIDLADVVFTDPPYGYSYESNYQDTHKVLLNDDKILDFLPNAFASMSENSALFVCASHQTTHKWRPLIDAQFSYKNLIVWKKNNWSMGDLTGAFAGQHELIFFAHKGRVELSGKRSPDVWEFDRNPPEHHPTQKPVALVAFAIGKIAARGVVLDLFGGSGTTLIACEQIGRRCRMMELSPAYCDVIVERWENLTGGKATRGGT